MPVAQTDSFSSIIHERLNFARRTPNILVIWLVFALVIAGIGWGTLFANLKAAHRTIDQRTHLVAVTLARSYSDRLVRSIRAIEQLIHHVRVDWRIANGNLSLEKLHALEPGIFPSPSLYYVTLINRDGMPVSSSLPDFKPVSLADRPYFQLQKEAQEDALRITPPLLGRFSERNVIHFSRRLTDANGAFSGIVLVSVGLPFFTANYDTAVLGMHGVLGFKSDDHAFEVIRIGENVFPPEVLVLQSIPELHSTSGSKRLGPERFEDLRPRYLGWQRVPGFPFTAIVGIDEADTFSDYAASRNNAITYGLAATLTLGLLTALAIALNVEMAWRKNRLDFTQATYRLATEEGSEGFYIVNPVINAHGAIGDFFVLDCNQRGAAFFNLRRQELVGKTISSFSGNFDIQRFIARLVDAFAKGMHDSEIEVPLSSPLQPRWVHLKVLRSGDTLAIRIRDISQEKAHVEALQRRGDEDVLTKLPNRHWIQNYLPSALDHAQKASEILAVLFIDLDGFKKVNDTAGHRAGDELLQLVARRLQVATRPHDKVVRFGGDEFVVVLESLEHRMDAAHVAERILHAFEEPFQLTQGAYAVGTSIGIALFPSDGHDAAVLLERADIAMYSVKTNSKGDYQFYEARFYNALRARLDKEAEIKRGIVQNEFLLYYQPRMDVKTGEVLGLEALVRWDHPKRGLLEPQEFIVLAEETGSIVELGELVIDKVCAQLAEWIKEKGHILPISINVSPRQFSKSDVAGVLFGALEKYGIAPHLIELEITESSMMAEGGNTANILSLMQRHGVKILVDDFGTGYSSLSQLQRLDFDVLKIDQAFTAEIDKSNEGKVFFIAIVTMAHALGMRVVAEGVETPVQIDILKELGCDEVQGFYLSRPLPPEQVQAFLRRKTAPN